MTDTEKSLAETAERPKPGEIGIVASGRREGYTAIVQQNGKLLMFNQFGDCYRRYPSDEWPEITPARLVPMRDNN